MLDSAIKTQLQGYLANLQHPIELVASLGEGSKDNEVRELIGDIAGLSDKVYARFDGTAARRPSFTVGLPGQDGHRITFAGVPMGHEFTSLVLALLQVSLGGLAVSLLGPRHLVRLSAEPSRVNLAGFAGLAHQPLTVGIVMYLTVFVVGGLVLMILGLTYWVKGFSGRGRPVAHRVR